MPPPEQLVSNKLKTSLKDEFNPFLFSLITPNTFFAPTAVAVSIGAFLKYPKSFKEAVLGVINVGGDTDSTASMTGALVGANTGLKAFPHAWMHFRPEYEKPLELGSKLFHAVLYNK